MRKKISDRLRRPQGMSRRNWMALIPVLKVIRNVPKTADVQDDQPAPKAKKA